MTETQTQRPTLPERLGLSVIPGAGWRARDIQAIARDAEEAGFNAIFTTEVNNDALATAQLMGAATERIRVGTWIANIYLRHSYVCAQGAALIADATGGRFILGLGVSHQPVNQALGIDMANSAEAVRQYVIEVRQWLRGDGPTTHLPQHPAPEHVPIYVAALTSRTV
jgi:alkanesulfonate monooxygenase SsuD/methylene tetrahydromethanopterin reductase-like flavin-dependent oxidoreductase (luciferase family)